MQHAPVRSTSPFVSLSAQCSLLDRVGPRPHAFAFIDANTVLGRGGEGLSFTTPAVVAASPTPTPTPTTTTTDEPAVKITLPDPSGSSLFYPDAAGPTLTNSFISGSALGAALAAFQLHFEDGAGRGEVLVPHEIPTPAGPTGTTDTRRDEGSEAIAKSAEQAIEAPAEGSAALAYPLPWVLARRSLLRVLLTLRLPGRSPAATFSLCPCAQPTTVGYSDTVRFRVTLTAARDADGTSASGGGDGDGFLYDVGVLAAEGTPSRKRRREEERAPLPTFQCRLSNHDDDEDTCIAEVDDDALCTARGVLVSNALLREPSRLTAAKAVGGGGGVRIATHWGNEATGKGGGNGESNSHFVSDNVLPKIFCYSPPQPPSAPEAMVGFLQRGCFTLLSLLAHLSWCRYVAKELRAKVQLAASSLPPSSSPTAGEEHSKPTSFLLLDAMTKIVDPDEKRLSAGGAVYSESSADDGFTSLLVIAAAVEKSSLAGRMTQQQQQQPQMTIVAPTPAVQTSNAEPLTCVVVVRVSGTREQLRWKALSSSGGAQPSWPADESHGTLRDLISACFP